MKVKDIIKRIHRCQEEYGDDFLDWDVYTEQCDEYDKKSKRLQPEWKTLRCPEDWEYFECAGFWTIFEEEKVFTINVNY